MTSNGAKQKLSRKIEAILFASSEPRKTDWLAKTLGASREEIENGLQELEAALKERGIKLLRKGDEFCFSSDPEFSPLIEKILKEEISADLSKASLETLAIIAYQGPLSRREIEYIRGVNSSFTLRNLLIRGLIEKEQNPQNLQNFTYQISFDFMRLLGITKKQELPCWSEFNEKLEKFLSQSQNESES